MVRSTLVLCLVLAACARSGARGSAETGEMVRVCIENATIGYGEALAEANGLRFSVGGGDTVCKEVGVTRSAIALRARTTSGGMGGPLSFSTSVDPARYRCWHWKLANTPDSRRARPCDEV